MNCPNDQQSTINATQYQWHVRILHSCSSGVLSLKLEKLTQATSILYEITLNANNCQCYNKLVFWLTSLYFHGSCQVLHKSPWEPVPVFPSVLWHWCLGDRKGIWPVKNWVLVCWWWHFDWNFACLTATVVANTSIIFSTNKKLSWCWQQARRV